MKLMKGMKMALYNIFFLHFMFSPRGLVFRLNTENLQSFDCDCCSFAAADAQ